MKIITIIGPSGSGKTTLGNYLKHLGCEEIISHTTRSPRVGEIDGLSYYFVDKQTFDKLNKVENITYAGNHYCTSKEEIEERLKHPCKAIYAVVTYEGYQAIKQHYPAETISVFVNTAKEDCIKRMIARGDSEEKIAKRIENFDKDKEFDNKDKCDYIVDNENLTIAMNEISAILMQEMKAA